MTEDGSLSVLCLPSSDFRFSRDEDKRFRLRAIWRRMRGVCPLFDIVNGFLIDAAPHGVRLWGLGFLWEA